jgi:hypothetical protein
MERKLINMPVLFTTDRVDEYIGLVLEAAKTGDMTLIK